MVFGSQLQQQQQQTLEQQYGALDSSGGDLLQQNGGGEEGGGTAGPLESCKLVILGLPWDTTEETLEVLCFSHSHPRQLPLVNSPSSQRIDHGMHASSGRVLNLAR